MANVTDIANRALLSIGARAQVSSVTPSDGSTEANAIAVLYQPTFEALAQSAMWNCLRKQVVLTCIQAAIGTPENPDGTSLPQPPTPWQYGYAYPSDGLRVRFLQPSLPSATSQSIGWTSWNNAAPLWIPGGGMIPFETAYSTDQKGNPIRIILTNQEDAQAVYTVNQSNPVIWDSQFQAAMVASLAAYLVPALNLNLPLMANMIRQAESIIALARATDGNEGYHTQDHVPDWMRARNGASGLGWGGVCGGWYGTYTDMVWPG